MYASLEREEEKSDTHTPEEMALLLALFLGTCQQVKLGSVGGEGEVKPSAGQQLADLLDQLQVGSAAERCKGRLCDPKHIHIFHLRKCSCHTPHLY